jgi:hypothetical protein
MDFFALATGGPLTADEVALLMDRKRATVDHWRRRGILPPTDCTPDGVPLWNREAVVSWGYSTGRLGWEERQQERLQEWLDANRPPPMTPEGWERLLKAAGLRFKPGT